MFIIPDTIVDLIEQLNKKYPDKCPDPAKDTDREVWFKAGQRSVVNFLIEAVKSNVVERNSEE